MELNHIGIAVSDVAQMQKLFGILGLQTTSEEEVAEQGVRTFFLPIRASQANLELLKPLQEGAGPIGKFLQKQGPGVHHLSFKVKKGELDPLCARLVKEGFRLTFDTPKPGAHGMRVQFIHPASAGGVLIEVMEPV